MSSPASIQKPFGLGTATAPGPQQARLRRQLAYVCQLWKGLLPTMTRRSDACMIVFAAILMLSGCGGGSESAGRTGLSGDAVVTALRLQARALAANSATTEEAATRLMDHAESTFPTFFPLHKPDASHPPFLYRFYPETGVYLGVVVTPGSQYELNGVYVMGGRFGRDPYFVGPLASFIPPTPAPPPAEASSLARLDVSGVPGVDPERAAYYFSANGQTTRLFADETKRLRVVTPLVLEPAHGTLAVVQDGSVLYQSPLSVIPLTPRTRATESFLQQVRLRLDDAIAVGSGMYPADPTLQTLRAMRTAVEASLRVADAIRSGGTVTVKDEFGADLVLGQQYLALMDQLATHASANFDSVLGATGAARTARARQSILSALARVLIRSAHADEQISRWATFEQYLAYTNAGTTVLATAVSIVAVAGLGPPASIAVGIYGLAVVANGAAAIAKEWWAPSSGFPTSGDWEEVWNNSVGLFFAAAKVGDRIVKAADRFAGTSDVLLTSFEKTAFEGISTLLEDNLAFLASKLGKRVYGSLCPDGTPPAVSWSTGIGYCR